MADLDPVVQPLLDGLHAQLPPGFRLVAIEVAVGERVEVNHDALRGALERALPGVEVVLRLVPAVLRCLDCGATYPADEFPCPACGSGRAELIAGDELGIVAARGTV